MCACVLVCVRVCVCVCVCVCVQVGHVIKSGYMIHDRVLRPAEVGVTK